MATSHAVRSLRNLFVLTLVVGSLTTACKRSGSGSDVDPRDQYVGVYEGSDGAYNSTITIGTFPTTERGATSITITKSANPKEIYLAITNRAMTLTAELNGTDFTVVDRTSDKMTININGQQNVFDGSFTATGTFGKDPVSGKDVIAINAVTEAQQLGTTIRRTESINGIRK